MNEKDRRLAALCGALGREGIWIRRRSNVAWASDGADVHVDASSSLGVASLLWTPRRKLAFCDGIEARRLAEEELGGEWEVAATPWWDRPPEPEGDFACDWPDDVLVEARASLTELEVGRARELGSECAATVQTALQAVRRGWSEHEVAGELAGALRRRGIFAPVLLVAADGRIERFRHPIPTNARIERAVMVALCAQRRGLIVCLTRLVHFGRLSPDLRRRHDAVCGVDAALHAATRAGERWCDLFEVAVRAYREAGYEGEWTRHHQGGPMGYEPRDYKATPSETRRVAPRQLVGWNPSITGTKSEDTLLSDGEVLTAMADWPAVGGRPDILCRP